LIINFRECDLIIQLLKELVALGI